MREESDLRELTLKNIAKAVSGRYIEPGQDKSKTGAADLADTEATAVVIDSRKIVPGAVFVATKGERADGHDYIGQVFEQGALGVICERIPEGINGPCIVVEDSFAALKKLAGYYRSVMKNVRIVGIVGSVGKTSTKELVASVLGEKYCVLKTEGNFNNEIGVPLTLLRIRDEHEIAVVEMGISDFGEMSRLGDMVRPNGVVMTNIGPCHLEKLVDLDGVLKAKSEVFDYIDDDGFLALNGEDEKLNTVKGYKNLKVIRFGEHSDVYAKNPVSRGLEGSEFTVCTADGEAFETMVPLPGRHMVMNSLAATAVAEEFGLTEEQIDRGIRAVKPVAGRSNLIRTENCLVVDDCYNANPKSMKAAVGLMSDALGRKVAILGDMFELGEDAATLHAEVGEYAATHGIDKLICVGELSENMYKAAKSAGMEDAAYFKTREELLAKLSETGLERGDTVLVKASHGMGFAEVIKALQ